MSAITDAMKNQPKAPKTFRDVYRGSATVKEVNPLEPRFTDGLTEEEASRAFDVQLIVVPDDASVPEQEIVISHSARALKFDPSKTEAQKCVEDLTKQGLVTGGDVSTVFAAVGKKVNVNAYEETSAKGTFARCKLAFGPAKLSQAEILRRIAAVSGKPAAPAANPFA